MANVFDTFNAGITASLNAHQHRAAGKFDDGEKCDQQAVRHFETVLQSEPKHASALGGKAMSLASLRQTQDAVIAFEAAIAVDPNAEFHRQLGLCHIELGDMEKAWLVTRKAIALDDSAEYRATTGSELFGFGSHIFHSLTTNRDSMTKDQLIAYHQWAASTFALACEVDPNNRDAQPKLNSIETALQQLS